MNYELILHKLQLSKFRSSFHLNKNMQDYVKTKGLIKITNDAYDLITKRLAPKVILNDGRQTPMKSNSHPVFIAQHACACCCRGCLYKWHHIPMNKKLSKEEIDYIVGLLITWIKKETKIS